MSGMCSSPKNHIRDRRLGQNAAIIQPMEINSIKIFVRALPALA